MKNIALFVYSLGPGGAERVVSLLCKHLSNKYKITLFLINEIIFYEVPKNIKIISLEKVTLPENNFKKFLKLPLLALKYKKYLKKEGIEVSISFMNRPNYINIFSKIFGSKVKTIVSERVAPSQEYNKISLRNIVSKFLIKTLYPFSDLIVPNSNGIKHELEKYFKISSKKIKVIYNPIDFDNISCLKKENINIKKNKFVFINIGRFDPQKNQELLIKSFYELHIDAELWLIGDGILREDLKKLTKVLRLENKVKFFGFQKNPYKFLSYCDCFVLSSNYEGFPNVLLEALACELPVISTDCKYGPREILCPEIDDNFDKTDILYCKYGMLVPVENLKKMTEAMYLIKNNSQLRFRYKNNSLKRIKDFDIKNVLKEWINIINKISS